MEKRKTRRGARLLESWLEPFADLLRGHLRDHRVCRVCGTSWCVGLAGVCVAETDFARAIVLGHGGGHHVVTFFVTAIADGPAHCARSFMGGRSDSMETFSSSPSWLIWK